MTPCKTKTGVRYGKVYSTHVTRGLTFLLIPTSHPPPSQPWLQPAQPNVRKCPIKMVCQFDLTFELRARYIVSRPTCNL